MSSSNVSSANTEGASTPSANLAPPVTAPGRAEKSLERADAQRLKNTEKGPIFPSTVPWRAVIVFTVLALGLAWLVQLPVWMSGEGMQHPLFGVLTTLMMFTPTIAALVVVFVVKRPANIPRLLGLSPIRPWKRTLLFVLIALLGMPVLAFAAMLVGQALGLIRLDLTSFSGFVEGMQALGQEIPGGNVQALVIMQLLLLPVAAIFSSFAAFGEELGWRGWLLPNLLPLGTLPALLISGAIWGVWHAPVILLGYNYGRTDILGVLLMVGWCVLLGVVIGWLRLRSASVWPAVFAHGAINASTNLLLATFIASGQGQEIIWGSILGWSGWIVLGIVILLLIVTGQLRKQPQPGLTPAESAR